MDASHCLAIITVSDPKTTGEEATVYRASPDDSQGIHARLTRASSRSSRVCLSQDDTVCNGVYNGADRITWDDGTKWHRLEISNTQASLMTRRAYIPMTFLFMACLAALASWLSDATVAVWYKVRSVAKKESVV